MNSENCVCCNSNDLELLLDLKEQPLANSYRKNLKQILPKYPLGVNFCRNCSHVQLTYFVNPDDLFKDYLYVSGTSKSMHRHFDWFSDYVIEQYNPKNVLDIACNDGTQLDYFSKKGLKTFGIDPAENLFEISSKKHKIVCDYFQSGIYKSKFDAILAQNVFAHVQNPLKFLQDCEEVMDDNSHLFIQTSQANMILENQFDTIYHEHISFFNINSMNELVKRSGLFLIDVIKTQIHGISYIFVLNKRRQNQCRIENLLDLEHYQGLQNFQTYDLYRRKVVKILSDFQLQVATFRNAGYKAIGYGAAAKGMTFLTAAEVQLDVIIDDNELKQGMFCPGQNTKIVPIDYLKSLGDSDMVLFIPLAWNYFSEIKQRIQEVRNNSNDHYLTYFPDVRIE